MTDDGHLIDSTLAGDTDAFGILVRKYQDRLFTTMVHVVGSVAEAEDVVQDAFLQAFTKLHTFQGNSKFYTWLYRIAFNNSISRRRRRRPRTLPDGEQLSQQLDLGLAADSVADAVYRREQVNIVRNALGQLSEDYRRILVLRELDGRNYEEIADVLDLPIGTVRSRLHRARKELLSILKTTHTSLLADG